MIALKRNSRFLIRLFIVITALGAFYACSESISDNPVENKAPETSLFLFPDEDAELSQQRSRMKVHWWGDDPDGLVIGYYFRWDGLSEGWSFTTKNDSIFSLPIGTADTTFAFEVVAVDNEGNGKYDTQIIQEGVDFGPEPFIDSNGDGVYNKGEKYYDIGLIDPTPAKQKFPIKNTAPEIIWSKASVLPLESFPVTTVSWDVDDLDGIESIVKINIALNDTNEVVELERSVKLITLRIADMNAANPEMDILINGSESEILSERLKNLKLDDNNRLYIQAEDISGAKSKFISLPEEGKDWFVKKPKGKLLIVDDYNQGGAATDFYNNAFDAVRGGALKDKYDVLDLEPEDIPFPNITFLQTLKLFDFVYWYGDDQPSLDKLNLVTKSYLAQGGKMAFSMTFQDSSDNFQLTLPTLQNFLQIDALGEKKPANFMFPNAELNPFQHASGYPPLKTAATVGFVRTYVPSSVAQSIYNLSGTILGGKMTGTIAFIDNSKTLFFIGLPLHQCDGNEGSVNQLLEKVFFDEFGLSL